MAQTPKPVRIVERQGPLFPDGHSTIFQVRAGARGTGRLLYEHEGRGNVGRQVASDTAEEWAIQHGYNPGSAI